MIFVGIFVLLTIFLIMCFNYLFNATQITSVVKPQTYCCNILSSKVVDLSKTNIIIE